MYQRVMTGPVTDQVAEHVTTDLNARERWVMAPLIAVILALGFVPQIALNVIEPTVVATLNQARISDPVVPFAEK